MKSKWMALLLMASGSLFAETHVAIGVQLGAPYYAPARVVAYRPPCPGPGYIWIDGYRDPYGTWFNGYWVVPPYAGAYWVAPRFYGGHFYRGYWGGARHFDRDWHREHEWREHERWEHGWRDRGRDSDHHDRDRGRGHGWGRSRH